jgi:hypothetical protein
MKLLAAAVLLCALPQEKIDNPEYANWKAFKPGTWVKHKMAMDVGGQMMETETQATLVEVTAEKVVLENKTSVIAGGRRMDLPGSKREVPAKIEKKEGQKAPSDKEEEVTVDGKTYTCRAAEWEQTEKGQTMKSKGWICADVPGGVVKAEVSSPQLPKPMQLVLAGFEKK